MSSNATYESKIKEAKKQLTAVQLAALKAVGKYLVKLARKNAPKKTGKLRKSIQYFARRKDLMLQIGVKAWYAKFIEKGSSRKSATPFLTPAVEQNIASITELYANLVREGMEKLGYIPPNTGGEEQAEGSD